MGGCNGLSFGGGVCCWVLVGIGVLCYGEVGVLFNVVSMLRQVGGYLYLLFWQVVGVVLL